MAQSALGIDADTLEIRAIEVAGNGVGDTPMLPAQLKQIPSDEALASISADGAYDTKVCHVAIAARHVETNIPVRKNGRLWKEDGAGAWRGTKFYALPAGWAQRSGSTGVATT